MHLKDVIKFNFLDKFCLYSGYNSIPSIRFSIRTVHQICQQGVGELTVFRSRISSYEFSCNFSLLHFSEFFK
jgi:hypothetical protein